MFNAIEGMVKILFYALSSTALIVLLMVTTALVWGGPGMPAPITSINDPFKSVDFSNMPPLKHYQGADGAKLFYREYMPQGASNKGSAVLVHGSSASSDSMHPMATALSAAGVHVYSLDVRGHGASGHTRLVSGHPPDDWDHLLRESQSFNFVPAPAPDSSDFAGPVPA
jgi:hypothetical protein